MEPLRSAEADAYDFHHIAKQSMGYDHSTLLIGKEATCETVLAAIHNATQQLTDGDKFFLTYSGHGSELTNPFYRPGGNDEPSDQTWCLYDRMLIDDEIFQALKTFKKGVKICMISDSCHSGTIAKDLGTPEETTQEQLVIKKREEFMEEYNLKSRAMKSGVAQKLYQLHHATYHSIYEKVKANIDADIKATVKQYSACQDDEVAFDGVDNGLFTSQIKKIIASDNGLTLNSQTFYDKLQSAFDYPNPNLYELGPTLPSFDNEFPLVIDKNRIQPYVANSLVTPKKVATASSESISGTTNIVEEWVLQISSLNRGLSSEEVINILPYTPNKLTTENPQNWIAHFEAVINTTMWEVIHVIHSNGRQAQLQLEIESILSDQFPTEDENATRASAAGVDYLYQWPPITTKVRDFPLRWHLEDTHSQLKSARDKVWMQLLREELTETIKIAHLDTGWAPNHPALVNNKNINKELAKSFIEGEDNPTAEDIDTGKGQQWHGTGTLTILAGKKIRQDDIIDEEIELFGCIPFAEIVPMRIADSVVIFNASSFLKAIEYAIEIGCEVVTMSMGGKPSKKMAKAINLAYEHGITVVTAAGNCFIKGSKKIGPRTLVYPARFQRVIAACGACHNHLPYDFDAQKKYVGSKRGEDALRWMQGNWGPPKVMNSAIASYTPNILWAEKRVENEVAKYYVKKNGGGTSSATPQIASAAALWIIQHREALEQKGYRGTWRQVEAVRHALFSSAYQDAFKGHEKDYLKYSKQYYGNGILRAKDALAVGVIEIADDKKAPEAKASLTGIPEMINLLFARKQKSLEQQTIPISPALEQELTYHILNNTRSIEILDEFSNSSNETLLTELIGILEQEPLSKELNQIIH